jgi:hypothetical protein
MTIVLTSANFQGSVLAAESTEEQIVYVDGNEISVSVNAETGTIVAQSTDRNDDSYLEISSNGESVVTVYDETEEKFDNYSLEIEELSYNDVDVDVVDDDGEVVESFDSPDDVIEDAYDGQAAVVVVVTGITVGTINYCDFRSSSVHSYSWRYLLWCKSSG